MPNVLLLMSVILPMLLVITSFIGGASLVLDATAGERERQSLEPLLTTPVSRHIIVSGKIVAACAVGLLSLLLTLLAFKLSAQLASAEMSQQLNVRFIPMLQMLFILLPVLFMGTALLTFLAAAAKSVKEAQSHISMVAIAAGTAQLRDDGVSIKKVGYGNLRSHSWHKTSYYRK